MSKRYQADPKLLYVWWIRTALVVFILCLFTTIVFPLFSLKWYVGMGLLLGIFTLLVLWYYPAFLERYYFTIENGQVIIRGGIFFGFEKRASVKQIQFTIWNRTILERFMGISSLKLVLLGGKMRIFGLNNHIQQLFLSELAGTTGGEEVHESL